MTNKELTSKKQKELLGVLKERFEKHMHRHQGIHWNEVEERLNENPEKLWSLYEMERTEGEPDVVGVDEVTGEYVFCDCSKESPKGRRSICYDQEALETRKKNKPENSAMKMAREMGIENINGRTISKASNVGAFRYENL